MDARFVQNGITFIWDERKASSNLAKHGISFESAAEAFFDPLFKLLEAGSGEEERFAIMGKDSRWTLLFVVHIEVTDEAIRIISARRATRKERTVYEN